ncbi:MAG TPA: polysialyltransferase family glycosyltransferase [Caldimonas sp.]|jgi:hypothetical protein|nr:polysialyltransferase family glycosyltransferase [Caldimonas sp.]HEX2540680.1 polysialyltransferase family glycosyltransferase [Caldimonas sp.]
MVSGTPRVRVGFALGSWQVVALAAALAEADAQHDGVACEDHLVLYETVPVSHALKTAMREIASAARPWHCVVDAFDLMASVRRKISQREFDALKERLRSQLGVARVDELWLCFLTRAPEKLVMDAWPEAMVQVYEDGLFSYLPQPPTPLEPEPASLAWPARVPATLRGWLDARRPVRRFRRHKAWLDPRHAARIAGAWMLLADLWPAPAVLAHVPRHAVAAARLREVLAACRRLPAVRDHAVPAQRRPAVLVLGQTLSRWGALSRADELAIYAEAIATIVERGYDVWWKEHPRAQEPFLDDLLAGAPPGRVREVALPFALPVELVAESLGLAACVAGISTAIFYLPRLYGIPAFSFADALAPVLEGRWALQNELVRRAATPLSALPAASPATPATSSASSLLSS